MSGTGRGRGLDGGAARSGCLEKGISIICKYSQLLKYTDSKNKQKCYKPMNAGHLYLVVQ